MSEQPLLPKLNPFPESKGIQSYHNKTPQEQNYAFLDEEVCIETKVKVNPDVKIGKIKIDILESEVNPCYASEESMVVLNQIVRIKIPIRLGAKVDSIEGGIYRTDEIDYFH